jgi:ABC-type glycerol-3-phosphate transport system substrate-binding protein
MQRQCRSAIGKSRFAAIVVLAVSGLVSGCRGPKAGPPPRPAPRWTDVTLRILCPAESPARRLLETHGRTWAHENGARLTFVERGDGDLEILAPPDLPTEADRNAILPLRDASVTAAFLPLYRSRLLSWVGKTYALPLLGEGFLCVYRADLYADAATKAAYREKHGHDLTPPVTWDEFATQAAFFSERRGKPSLPPLPADEPGIDRAFGAIVAPFAVRAATGSMKAAAANDPSRTASFSFQYDVETGEPRLTSPGYVEALKLFQQLHAHRSTKPNVVAALRDDEAVMGIVTLDELAALRGGGRNRWGVTRIPGSRRVFAPGAAPEGLVNFVPYVGSSGALGAVRTGTQAADAAFDLLHYLSGETVSQEVVHNPALGGGLFRDAHLSKQPSGWFAYDLDEINTSRLRDALRDLADPRLDNPAIALRIPRQASHRKVLVDALRRVLHDKSDPSAALAEADREWRKLDGDPAKARDLYRKSLGL